MQRHRHEVAALLVCLLAALALSTVGRAAPVAPGLSLVRLELLRSTVHPGGSIRYKDDVRNRGRRTTPVRAIRFWLSVDAVRGSTDVLLRKRRVAPLRTGAGVRVTGHLTIPASTRPRTYRLIGCVTAARPASCRVARGHVQVTRARAGTTAPAGPTLLKPPAAAPATQDLAAPAPPEPPVGPPDTVPPSVAVSAPADGATLADTTPALRGPSGTAPGDDDTVTVRLHVGSGTDGPLAAELHAPVDRGDATWSTTPASPLADGRYTVQARQSDAAGNTASSAPRTFTVDTTAPQTTLDSGPTGTTNQASPQFTFSSENGATFACKLDGPGTTTANYAACSSPRTYTALTDGDYTLSLRATDPAGNTDPTPATRTFTVDTTGPAVTVDSPLSGATLTEPKPTFGGTAGTSAGDSASVTLKLFPAAAPAGTPTRTATAAVGSDGTWTTTLTAALPEGDYVARAVQSDAAGNRTVTPDRAFTLGPAHLLAAGDIASCLDDGDEQTAGLLAGRAGTVAALGDEVYGDGSRSDGSLAAFNDCYGPNWGQERARTMPVPGNHEYEDPNAAGYFSYFGASAGDPAKGYYSYDLGAWHVVALNSSCPDVSCAAGGAQETWLRADLAAHPASCTLAYFHHPLFSSAAENASTPATAPLWRALETGRTEVVLNGHAHTYERFAPQTSDGVASATGIREFVVGTGGKSHFTLTSPRAVNSEVGDTTSYGILDLSLHQGSYDWSFVPVPGSTFADAGTTACH